MAEDGTFDLVLDPDCVPEAVLGEIEGDPVRWELEVAGAVDWELDPSAE